MLLCLLETKSREEHKSAAAVGSLNSIIILNWTKIALKQILFIVVHFAFSLDSVKPSPSAQWQCLGRKHKYLPAVPTHYLTQLKNKMETKGISLGNELLRVPSKHSEARLVMSLEHWTLLQKGWWLLRGCDHLIITADRHFCQQGFGSYSEPKLIPHFVSTFRTWFYFFEQHFHRQKQASRY